MMQATPDTMNDVALKRMHGLLEMLVDSWEGLIGHKCAKYAYKCSGLGGFFGAAAAVRHMTRSADGLMIRNPRVVLSVPEVMSYGLLFRHESGRYEYRFELDGRNVVGRVFDDTPLLEESLFVTEDQCWTTRRLDDVTADDVRVAMKLQAAFRATRIDGGVAGAPSVRDIVGQIVDVWVGRGGPERNPGYVMWLAERQAKADAWAGCVVAELDVCERSKETQ